MFLIAVDSSGRLLVENKPKSERGNQRSTFCLPSVADSSSDNEILLFFAKIGIGDAKVIRNFHSNHFTDPALHRKYVVYSISSSHSSESKYEIKSLDEIWPGNIDDSVASVLSKILEQVEHNSPGSVIKLEDKFLRDFNLSKKSNRVFFANSEPVIANETVISFLGAFAVANGEKTARLCMHQDQGQVIQ